MKKIMLRAILFVVIITLMMPVTIGISKQNDLPSLKIIPSVYLINVGLWKLTKDGYFIYNVTNLGNQTIENTTMLVHIQGGAIFHGYVDVNTSIFIEYLPCLPGKTWQLYQTKDLLFTRRHYPIFHRPLIGTVTEELIFMGSTQRGLVHIIFGFLIERIA